MIATLVVADGTGSAPHAAALCLAPAPLRDIADAVHTICALHGTAPGVVDLAGSGVGGEHARLWLRDTAEWFAIERAALVALTAAVGPLPSTPGHAESEAAVTAQRHALATLARSDRAGCAIGAAIAFLLDWSAIRRVLGVAVVRTGARFDPPPPPDRDAIVAIVAEFETNPGADRAMMFGAQQLVAQHRGLWQLLEARASARRGV